MSAPLTGWIQAPKGVETRLADELKQTATTVYDLEKATGIHQNNLYGYRRGRAVPNGAHMLRIANALDCEIEHLWRLAEVQS